MSDDRKLASLDGHSSCVNSIAFSRDGRFIVSGSDDKLVKVWFFSESRLIFSLAGHTNIVSNSVAFSSDGQHIGSASNDKLVKVWSVFRKAEVGVSGWTLENCFFSRF